MKRALLLAAPAVLALGLVACGDDDDDTPESTEPVTATTDGDAGADITIPDITLPDITIPDITIPDLSDISIPDFTIPDLSDISIPDLSGITIPDFTIPEEARGIMESVIKQLYPEMDEDQVLCIAEQLGGNALNETFLRQIAETCDLDVPR
jgi:hypothetical protein